MNTNTGRNGSAGAEKDSDKGPLRATRHFKVFSFDEYQRWLKQAKAASQKKNRKK